MTDISIRPSALMTLPFWTVGVYDRATQKLNVSGHTQQVESPGSHANWYSMCFAYLSAFRASSPKTSTACMCAAWGRLFVYDLFVCV